MKELIEKLNALRPTEEQVKEKNAHYSFGWVDAINKAVELVKESDSLPCVSEWVAVEDKTPKEFESILGIEMPYVCRYACHFENGIPLSDETGDAIVITHWMYAPEPPFC